MMKIAAANPVILLTSIPTVPDSDKLLVSHLVASRGKEFKLF